jgi:6-phosphogluconolactonase
MLEIFKDPDSLLTALSEFILKRAQEAIARKGRFDFVLSGGGSPKILFELLASESYQDKIDWSKVFFFFGDERYVPLDDPQSNYRMAKKALFDRLVIAEDHVFPINTALPPTECARDYEKTIRKHFKNGSISFDFILLGLGDNSHTASLFPHTTVLHERQALIKEIFVEEVNMYRITFTAPLINAGTTIAFLVYGKSKAEAVHHILEDSRNVEEYPAQLIQPVTGELYWFLDKAAAEKINTKE